MILNEDFLDSADIKNVAVSSDDFDEEVITHPADATMYRMCVAYHPSKNYPQHVEENILMLARLYRVFKTQKIFPLPFEDVHFEMTYMIDDRSHESCIIPSKNESIRPLLQKLRARDDIRSLEIYFTFWGKGATDLDVLKFKINWRRIFECMIDATKKPIDAHIFLEISDEWGKYTVLNSINMAQSDLFLERTYEMIQDWEEK